MLCRRQCRRACLTSVGLQRDGSHRALACPSAVRAQAALPRDRRAGSWKRPCGSNSRGFEPGGRRRRLQDPDLTTCRMRLTVGPSSVRGVKSTSVHKREHHTDETAASTAGSRSTRRLPHMRRPRPRRQTASQGSGMTTTCGLEAFRGQERTTDPQRRRPPAGRRVGHVTWGALPSLRIQGAPLHTRARSAADTRGLSILQPGPNS